MFEEVDAVTGHAFRLLSFAAAAFARMPILSHARTERQDKDAAARNLRKIASATVLNTYAGRSPGSIRANEVEVWRALA
ncbi:hypothetical protein L284_08440 [Novosphingobium lindaniclasticum LE124]|uniref:Uncharacterized protein n=1 Tax=Novosphingobium lindaniclasticum LE124 TaxID=1096930 RepID=T0IZV4_9SPHN|nr:hypothetical protein L284_08440 [Novosphingobium lindaniclasticum LE124]